jgi:hypothetical protein
MTEISYTLPDPALAAALRALGFTMGQTDGTYPVARTAQAPKTTATAK